MAEDAELLRSYTDMRSEAAFTELVGRHVHLVYSVALRQVGGDAHLAEDVAQTVFTELARTAPALRHRATLGGWLYRCARNSAVDVVRAERRRRNREQEAQMRQQLDSDTGAATDWDAIRPLLDDAIGKLRDADRDAVCLRFFEGRSFAEVGARLQVTENTARMRVNRALERLRALLLRRNVTSTSAALTAALAGQTGTAAPAGLAGSLAATALAQTASGAASAAVGWAFLSSMNATKIALGSAVLITLAIGGIALYQSTPPPATQPKGSPTRQSESLVDHAGARTGAVRPLASFLGVVYEVATLDRVGERRFKYQRLFASMTAAQAPIMLEELEKHQSLWNWGEAMHYFFARWGELDGRTATAAVEAGQLTARAGLMAAALSGWAKVEPEIAWARTIELAQDWPQFASEVHRVMHELVRQDLAQAIAKHNDIPGPEGKRAISRAVIESASASGDFDAVLAEVAKFPSIDDQKTWINDIFTSWGSTGSDGAGAAISRIANPVLAESALSGYLDGWVRLDPVAAVDHVVEHRDEPRIADNIDRWIRNALHIAPRDEVLDIVQRVAAADALEPGMLVGISVSDPLFAMGVIDSLSDGSLRERATVQNMSGWIHNDFEAAADYVEQMPNDEIKFKTLRNIAPRSLTYKDGGEKILRWIEAMPDANDRARAVELLLGAANLPHIAVSSGSRAALMTLIEQTSNLSPRAQQLAETFVGPNHPAARVENNP